MPPKLIVDIFETPFAFPEWLMITGSVRPLEGKAAGRDAVEHESHSCEHSRRSGACAALWDKAARHQEQRSFWYEH